MALFLKPGSVATILDNKNSNSLSRPTIFFCFQTVVRCGCQSESGGGVRRCIEPQSLGQFYTHYQSHANNHRARQDRELKKTTANLDFLFRLITHL